jgi:superfamily II DNA or RNA helicase
MKQRDYQLEAEESTWNAFEIYQSVLAVMATGLGKTVFFSHVIKRTPKRSMVIAHRGELIHQAHDKIQKVTGHNAEIEMADSYANRRGGLFNIPVILGTVQTLSRGRMFDFDPQEFSLLVIDEAHHATASTYRTVIEYFKTNPECKILGVTATPDRTDEEALGQIFDTVSYEYGILDGILDGWLVPVKQNEAYIESFDVSWVGTSMGDLKNNELSDAVGKEETIHCFADSIMQRAGDRKTLIFVPSVANATKMSEIFNRPHNKPGSANYVCGKTPKDVRANMFREYAERKFQFLVNVGVATEGFDDPNIEVVAIARPTKSRCLYTQMAGRGARPHNSIAYQLNDTDSVGRNQLIAQSPKPSVEIIDFVGNSGRHKLVNSADILGGRYSDEIVDLAKHEIATKAKRGEPTEIISELKKCEREIARRHHEQLEAARLQGIQLRATFSIKGVDPFDVLGIVPCRIPAWDKDKEPTVKMHKFLQRENIDTDGMNFRHASQLIGAIIEKRKGRCQFKKHKDKLWTEVPWGYKQWCLKQTWLKANVRADILESMGKKDAS